MGFDTEADMREVAQGALRNAFNEPEAKLFEEFSYGSGRADYVLARVSEAYLSRRLDDLNIKTAIDNDRILQAFLLLHNRETISKDYYYEMGALDQSSKKEALNWLTEHGFAKEIGESYIRSTPNLRRHVTTAYSIELKLSKWKEALRQAFRGKGFSEYQCVVMDAEYVDRALNNKHRFEEHGIGLMSLTEDGHYEIHLKPERSNPYSLINKWRLNERIIVEASKSNTHQYVGAAGD
ncbi:hypothetical protein RBH20_13405 [Haloarcula sp. H-GB4]|uniref:hypothetical protein n=1 Tax=Haloarcula sp. H-GB4 TaxID=3069755 RepID=UPI0027B69C5A|nr:hypothetical protein [Haloarcula sp. H-GB4]MDQ2073530.1 hypothetical protein [Haloarcula sp. H-GB4]